MQAQKLSTVSCDTPIERVAGDGAIVISNYVSRETRGGLAEELEPYLSATLCGEDPYFAGTQTPRVARIISRNEPRKSCLPCRHSALQVRVLSLSNR